MTAIKSWFLEKNDLRHLYKKELKVERETEKAVLVYYFEDMNRYEHWIPKSCIADEWEELKKDTSNFAYHDYLVEVINNAYRNGTLENRTFTSGRNKYDLTSFTHQKKTVEMIEFLNKNNIEYMDKETWKKN